MKKNKVFLGLILVFTIVCIISCKFQAQEPSTKPQDETETAQYPIFVLPEFDTTTEEYEKLYNNCLEYSDSENGTYDLSIANITGDFIDTKSNLITNTSEFVPCDVIYFNNAILVRFINESGTMFNVISKNIIKDDIVEKTVVDNKTMKDDFTVFVESETKDKFDEIIPKLDRPDRADIEIEKLYITEKDYINNIKNAFEMSLTNNYDSLTDDSEKFVNEYFVDNAFEILKNNTLALDEVKFNFVLLGKSSPDVESFDKILVQIESNNDVLNLVFEVNNKYQVYNIYAI